MSNLPQTVQPRNFSRKPHKYFSATYSEARERFRRAAAERGMEHQALRLSSAGPGGEELTIDIALLRRSDKSTRAALVHVSGMHGVEGFAGSAIQLQLMEHAPAALAPMDLCFIHAINPYGMAWLRRVNENNVDLNRNFLNPGEPYSDSSPDYRVLDSFLNPGSPPRALDSFYVVLAARIARYGVARFKQAVSGGQYTYPRGLVYGGAELQEGPKLLMEWLRRELSGASRIALVDVHTGLGPFGHATLLGSGAHELAGEPANSAKVVHYRTRGSFLGCLSVAFPEARWLTVAQEFGTISSVAVLKALRDENRLWHYGCATDLNDRRKIALRRAFDPDDDGWRDSILAQGRDLPARVAERLLTS
jgi:hypothetical protein